MKYRPEIDGLRAIAVLSVILFHVGLRPFSGGYIGVDIFFVISGYLITSIIVTELEQGHFSLARFYARRARRILPALSFVLLFCIPFAWWLYLPEEMSNFAQSLMAVAAFGSNFFFWRENPHGYFTAGPETFPLLHTWSLAVEEQFYIVFPLLLGWLVMKGRRRMIAVTCLIAVVSLLFAEWGWRYKPVANFYLIPGRTWELLAGALLAMSPMESLRNTVGRQIAEFMSWIGLIAIITAVALYNEAVPFPSVYSLLPVLGTVLIILFSGQTYVGRLLACRPLVLVGLISYSAYLWHHPVISFFNMVMLTPLSAVQKLEIVGLVLIMAWISTRFVEKPFRQRTILSTNHVLLAAAMSLAVMLLAGLALTKIDAQYFRFDKSFIERGASSHLKGNEGLGRDCGQRFPSNSCTTGTNPDVLVWGDSYSMHLVRGLEYAGVSLIQASETGCGPNFFQVPLTKYGIEWSKNCMKTNQTIRSFMGDHRQQGWHVILSSPFIHNMTGPIFDGTKVINPSIDVRREAIRQTLKEVINLGWKPVLVAPPPQTGENIGRCVARLMAKLPLYSQVHSTVDCSFAQSSRTDLFALAFIEEAIKDLPVTFVRFDKYLCDVNRCSAIMDGIPIYADEGHLSVAGSRHIEERFRIWSHYFSRSTV